MLGISTSIFLTIVASAFIVFNAGVYVYFRFFCSSSEKKESKNEMRKRREINYEELSKDVSYSQNIISSTIDDYDEKEELSDADRKLLDLLNGNDEIYDTPIQEESNEDCIENYQNEQETDNNADYSLDEESANNQTDENESCEEGTIESIPLESYTKDGYESEFSDEFPDDGFPTDENISDEVFLNKLMENNVIVTIKNKTVSSPYEVGKVISSKSVRLDFSDKKVETTIHYHDADTSFEADTRPNENGKDFSKVFDLIVDSENTEDSSEPDIEDLDEVEFNEY